VRGAINILPRSVACKQVRIRVLCEVINQKGNATSREDVAIIKQLVEKFGKARIKRVSGDGEFGSKQLFEYLIKEAIDVHIRLKESHLAHRRSFKQLWTDASEKVKLRGKVAMKVFGWAIDISCVKYQKKEKTQYLIEASKECDKYAIEEYKVRWQIETMFGGLKSRGFDFEETHLTMPQKISKLLMLLGRGLCLAMLKGEVEVKKLKRVKLKLKKNKRYAKSLFRIGLDSLQNVLLNSKTEAKYKQLQVFIDLLSCA